MELEELLGVCSIEGYGNHNTKKFLKCHMYPVGEHLIQLFDPVGVEFEDNFRDTPDWSEGKQGHFYRSRHRKDNQPLQQPKSMVSQKVHGSPKRLYTESIVLPTFPPNLVNKLCYKFSRKTLKSSAATRPAITAYWDRIFEPFRYEVISIRMEIGSDEKDCLLEALSAMLFLFQWTAELAPVACSKFMYMMKCRENAVYEDFFSLKDPACETVAKRFTTVLDRLKLFDVTNSIHWRAYLWYSVVQVENCESMRLSGWSDAQMFDLLDKMFEFHMSYGDLVPNEEN